MKKYCFVTLLTLLSGIWALPIPSLINVSDIDLEIDYGTLQLSHGISNTMGFNGDYLGPTILAKRGDLIKFNVQNNLDEDTTVHWHGLHVPAEYDGGPHQVIESGNTWKPKFYIKQQAATLWYHPHLMGKTAEHVYNGLAGLFIIEDEYSMALDIPQDYGVNDIPLIIQDRRVSRSGTFEYSPSMHDNMMGYVGNTLLINGAEKPELELKSGTYRFRVLNGSNSSIYRFRFSDNREFTVIASDGGFLPKSVSRDYLIISPGERYEILLDIDNSENFNLITDIFNGRSFNAMSISSTEESREFYTHLESFDYTPLEFNEKRDREREFIMETQMMGRFSINGKTMNMDRIDFTLNKDSREIWTIENRAGRMMQVPHSFHVHDVQFNIISINDKTPGPLYSGRKDTILVMPGEVFKITLHFKEYTGIYMYHCHFLEHEDSGMMGQFLIE